MYGLFGFLNHPNQVTVPSPEGRQALTNTKFLEQRIDTLELACAGLWELLRTKHGCTEQELIEAIHAVDARDGKVDGKISPMKAECPNCHRQLLTKSRNRCSWCGAQFNSIF